MPMGVVLAVVGLLVLAVLLLIAALYLLDSHAEQQRQRLQDLMRRSASVAFSSLQHHDKSHPEALKERNREASSQPCHICGSLRNRRSHGLDSSPLDASQLGSVDLVTPWRQFLAVGGKFATNTKHGLECLTGLQRGSSQLTTDLRKWLLKEPVASKERAFDDTQDNVLQSSVTSPVSPVVNSGGIGVGDVGVNSFPTVVDPIGSMVVRPVAGSASSMGLNLSSSSLPFSDCSGKSEIPKSAPLRRLVLEILMSPSADEGAETQSSHSSSTSGVRLKFEANSSIEHSADSDFSFEIKEDTVERLCTSVDTKQLAYEKNDRNRISEDRDVDTSIWTTINGSIFSGSVLSQESDTTVHMSDKKIVLTSLDVGVPGLELPIVNERLGMGLNTDIRAVTRELSNMRVKQRAVVPISANLLGTKGTVEKPPSLGCMASISGSPSDVTTLKDATTNANVKLRILTPPISSISQNLTSVSILDSMGGQQNSFHSEHGQRQNSFVSLEGLGSLRLAFLKDDTESKVSETYSKEGNSEIAAALSTLRVDSACAKVTGTRGGLASVVTSGEIVKNSCNVESSCANPSATKEINEAVRGEVSESDRGFNEGVHVVLAVSKCTRCESDEFDAKKRDKKKKKNRGRRQKGKVVTSISDGQERQEIGKIALEVAKHVSAVPETEIGCICGTPKGGIHSNSCPYPFTSSGSMLQRKIKEQYDELVQSNAAKTLTLAQVGRFTTCLVEAKAALQQKSDVIQRRFTIAKSLLTKADKSSFDRLCGQIYGLEAEQKKLEEDTVVYNRLQEQLKLSPAYQKMLEYGRTHFELQPHTGQMIEKLKAEDVELSFEELLAQEKKDGFWQKHGLSRSSVKVS